jgi:hypothetical protein
MLVLAVLSGLPAMAFGSEYSSNWGPAAGSQLPVLEARDQTGQLRTLDDLSGENGLLLLLNRSADW